VKDLSEIERAVPMSVLAAVAAAVAKLNAATAGRAGWWSYFAVEIGKVCYVRTKELAELGGLLADLETRRDAYSLWCATVPTRERLPPVPSPLAIAMGMLAADLAAWNAEGAPIANLEPDCEWSDRDIVARAGRALRPATLERVRARYRRLLARAIESEIAQEHERLRRAHEELDAQASARARERESEREREEKETVALVAQIVGEGNDIPFEVRDYFRACAKRPGAAQAIAKIVRERREREELR
jgi:hypothetical protein